MLPISSTQRVSDVEGVLVVEENNSFPDPLLYLDTEVLYYVHMLCILLLLFYF